MYQIDEYLLGYFPYREYFHRGHESGLSSVLDKGEKFKPEEGSYFWMSLLLVLKYFGRDPCF